MHAVTAQSVRRLHCGQFQKAPRGHSGGARREIAGATSAMVGQEVGGIRTGNRYSGWATIGRLT